MGAVEWRRERRGFFGRVSAWRRSAIPPEPPAPPVDYSIPLVAYASVLFVTALVIAIVSVRPPSDVSMLAVGALAMAGLTLIMVRSFGGVSAAWSPTSFVHLALTFSLGSIGAATSAVLQGTGVAIRLRTGWLRTVVNTSVFYLANMMALAVFKAITGGSLGRVWLDVLAGAVAGCASYAVNHLLLAAAIWLAAGVQPATFLRSVLSILPYDAAYGIGAAGFTAFAASGSAAFLTAWLVPVISLQSFLVVLARRTNAATLERERHAKERVDLLQQIITIADSERSNTASDLHDGPVAHLSGLAMLLNAAAENSTADRPAQMKEVAEELRSVQRDLRSMIFRLSPHDLHLPGRLREEILGKQLAPLREQGVRATADVPLELPLARLALELVHRVCAESLTNTLRHANARHVSVVVVINAEDVVLTVSDDGRGFSVEDVQRQRDAGHFGMRFLEEKAEAAGGELRVESAPDKGTKLTLRLPRDLASSIPKT